MSSRTPLLDTQHVANLRRSEDGEVGRGVVVGGVDARGDHMGGVDGTPAKPDN